MKKLKIPRMGFPGVNLLEPDTGGKHRAGGRKLVSKTGRHRLDKPNAVPPATAGRKGHKGAHRTPPPADPDAGYTPPGKGRPRRYASNTAFLERGARQTPADDRHGFFRR